MKKIFSIPLNPMMSEDMFMNKFYPFLERRNGYMTFILPVEFHHLLKMQWALCSEMKTEILFLKMQ
jgi:hypothetical protein